MALGRISMQTDRRANVRTANFVFIVVINCSYEGDFLAASFATSRRLNEIKESLQRAGLRAIHDVGQYIMGGERVTRSEWLDIAAPLVAVIGVSMALIALGFASQKHWSRHFVIAMFSLIIVYASILGALNLIHHTVMWRAIINASVFGAASVWYFYFKPNIAAYFREPRDRHNL